ncbi:MAG: hypothetical protein PWP45_159 [Tepidanaerobacteraceae bacterium]|nr:hypothetical protein [Tepidanaerobacteraceae bacterium]
MKQRIYPYTAIMVIMILIMFLTSKVLADNGEVPSIDIKELKNYNFEQSGRENRTNFYEKSFIGFTVYLGSIVLVCVLAVLVLRWMARYAKPSGWKSKYMEVLDVLYLDSKNRIYIVKSPAGVKLLGVSDKGIGVIGELDEKMVELIEEAEKSGNVSRNFGMQLEYFLKKFKNLSGAKDGDGKS